MNYEGGGIGGGRINLGRGELLVDDVTDRATSRTASAIERVRASGEIEGKIVADERRELAFWLTYDLCTT